MNIVNCVDWQAIGAIGTWVSGLGTILTVVVAVLPYIKKGKLYFTQHSNINEYRPELTIVNSKAEGMLIEKVVFYAGPVLFRKKLYIDNFVEEQDDLVSEKGNNFINPYTQKKISYNPTRIVHYITHYNLNIKGFSRTKIRIVVYSNLGRIKMKTKLRTRDFIESLLLNSKEYKHLSIKDIF